jgi:sugar/nucleoside kinase (ribokinase family)
MMDDVQKQTGMVVAIGEPLVEFMPAIRDETMAKAFRFKKYAGGAPATCAAAIVRLGGRACLISRVGVDPFSTFLLDALAAEGVNISHVKRIPDRQIGLVFHECLGGVTSLIFYRRDSAASTFTPEDIDPEVIRGAAALHIPGVTFQISESAKETCLMAARLAEEAGVLISFDPNIRNILGGTETRQAMEEVISLADVITPTLEEATAITGEENPLRAAHLLRARGPRVVAVTLGKEGSVLLGDGEPIVCPGYHVEVVEPTGAGDVYAAAIIIGLLNGWALERIGRFANAAGALAVTAMGHFGDALPTLERIRIAMEGTDASKHRDAETGSDYGRGCAPPLAGAGGGQDQAG